MERAEFDDLRRHLARVRAGAHDGPTAGLCPGFAQANLVVLPQRDAYDFLVFCLRNPKPCPVLGVGDPGEARLEALGVDVRTDAPRYLVRRAGAAAQEAADIAALWREDFVAVLLGCSFTFEHALLNAGLPVRHLAAGRNVAMYETAIACAPAGRFEGPLVVSMRGFPPDQVEAAADLSARFPESHGAPVHVGDPAAIGIEDLDAPDYGDPPALRPGDVPVFWACGVTPQSVVLNAAPEIAIFHKPGHMIITARRERALR